MKGIILCLLACILFAWLLGESRKQLQARMMAFAQGKGNERDTVANIDAIIIFGVLIGGSFVALLYQIWMP